MEMPNCPLEVWHFSRKGTYFYFTILANMEDFTCTLKFSLLPFSVVVNCKGVF